ncbi:lipopolysaccharide biosynthesis protein [Vibrio sp. PID23_8]|uniref:lipopolysaccharide biosynthesis protein n=1 Tax=unclassified Vibrio TaxID=2614977 RepID=UPI000E69499B|nr:lipopolysaccharide biosynthesis protein [Vibrio sp. PID23_8]RIZ55033.1 lipopolysaccharide biosynthesis protein [Vibrio sp. PID23_8]
MTTQTVEQRFQALRQTLKPAEFTSIEFLVAKAQQIEATDPELAQRILVRVTNLKKQVNSGEVQKHKEQGSKAKVESSKMKQDGKKAKQSKLAPLALLLEPVFRRPFIALVVIPTLIFALYQTFWASERYVSRAQVIVQQPDGMATMDASMAVLTGLGVSNTGVADTELVKAYILSNDMVKYLNEKLDIVTHFSQSNIDWFSRIDEEESWEAVYEYYLTRIDIYIDSNSNIVHVETQAFDPEFANRLTQTIVERAEWYINSIGHQLANAQLAFIQKEHTNIERKLQDAQTKLLRFQQQYNLLDPTAEGAAMQQITYGLEGQISAKEAELKSLSAMMSSQAPQVLSVKNTLTALKSQLDKERAKLSNTENHAMSVSEILTIYTDLKVKMELALQAYTSSQISLEKSRIEAYRQLKYLVVVEAATEPHQAKYPDVFYNITLFGVIATMLFVIGRIVLLTIQELK